MNARERYLETCSFNPKVRSLKWEFGYWGRTVKDWYAQGLPRRRYPTPPTTVSTPASSLYVPAWTRQGDGVLPNGIAVFGEILDQVEVDDWQIWEDLAYYRTRLNELIDQAGSA